MHLQALMTKLCEVIKRRNMMKKSENKNHLKTMRFDAIL